MSAQILCDVTVKQFIQPLLMGIPCVLSCWLLQTVLQFLNLTFCAQRKNMPNCKDCFQGMPLYDDTNFQEELNAPQRLVSGDWN